MNTTLLSPQSIADPGSAPSRWPILILMMVLSLTLNWVQDAVASSVVVPSPGPGGQAKAVGHINLGESREFDLFRSGWISDPGSGYTTDPAVRVVSGTGSGAHIHSFFLGGSLSSFYVEGGSGYSD